MADDPNSPAPNDPRNAALLDELNERQASTLDWTRDTARQRRHDKGFRTARENLDDLCDPGSFVEYGQLAVAAQRSRRSLEELRAETPADGVVTGIATINAELFGAERSRAAVVVNDYSVLAGTQGYFHHRKLDRILEVAGEQGLPVVMFAEGGGGRPGDVDARTVSAGLNVPTFAAWASLSGRVPRIAIANGYCFAGNAALFGSADITLATRRSWIGMAGPVMIEGGGLGRFDPQEIGPAEVQARNGAVDVVVEDEAEATRVARVLLGFFQGRRSDPSAREQAVLRDLLPPDRRYAYEARPLIHQLMDEGSFVELRRGYGPSLITGLARLEGRPLGLLMNDTQVLGGALDAAASEKAARFLQLLDAFDLPVLSLCDTPGFMVGPESEAEAAVRRMGRLFVVGARVEIPWVCLFLRKGYGLGAMAMAGGSLARPDLTVSWPQGEFGAMGLEGAVRLGFARELEAAETQEARQALFDRLLAELYEKGKAVEAAAYLEIDAVIDPADSRRVIASALASATGSRGAAGRRRSESKRFVDPW